jgi:hypothetical protein
VRLRDYELNFTSRAMSRVGKIMKFERGGGINILFGQIYRPLHATQLIVRTMICGA